MKNRSIFFLILLAFTLTQCNLKNAIDQQQAFFRQQAAPFQISKPMVDSTMIRLKTKFREIDPKSGKATRVGRKLDEAGKLVRVAKNSGEVIK